MSTENSNKYKKSITAIHNKAHTKQETNQHHNIATADQNKASKPILFFVDITATIHTYIHTHKKCQEVKVLSIVFCVYGWLADWLVFSC